MSRLTDGWLDDYGFRYVPNPRSAGSTYDPEGEGYPYRVVLHTTETDGMPNTATHQYPPQLWASYEGRLLIQTIPLTRSGFALYQGALAPYYTNRARSIQVELVGRADDAGSWSDAKLRWIAEAVLLPITKFVEAVGGRIDLSDAAVPLPGPHAGSARPNAVQRLDPVVWAFGPIGIPQHRHVPMGDDHYDADQLNARRIRDHLVAAIGGAGHEQPIPTQPKRRKFPMDMRVRRAAPVWNDELGAFVPGPVIVYPKGSPEAFAIKDSPVIMYDAPLVPAGARAVIAPIDPSLGRFQVVPIVANDGGQLPLTEAGWGAAASTPPLKTDSWVTFVVPERATEQRVRAYLVG